MLRYVLFTVLSLAVYVQADSWPVDDPACLPQLRHIAGFACSEDGTQLHYRKAAHAAINLDALAQQRSDVLCNGDGFFWIAVDDEYAALAVPYRGAPQQLVKLTVSVSCGTDPE